MLGEFGGATGTPATQVYQQWTDTLIRTGGNGFLYWILSGSQNDGSLTFTPAAGRPWRATGALQWYATGVIRRL